MIPLRWRTDAIFPNGIASSSRIQGTTRERTFTVFIPSSVTVIRVGKTVLMSLPPKNSAHLLVLTLSIQGYLLLLRPRGSLKRELLFDDALKVAVTNFSHDELTVNDKCRRLSNRELRLIPTHSFSRLSLS